VSGEAGHAGGMSVLRSPQRLCRKDDIRAADVSLQPYQKTTNRRIGGFLFVLFLKIN